MERTIHFRLNGESVRMTVDGARALLWVLRTERGLTGAKYGCGLGICGACTVLLNGEAVQSCQVPVEAVDGMEVTTIEGLEKDGRLHPVQEAFVRRDALQCGFCTPGMIMKSVGFLKENPDPRRGEVIRALDDNLCRCGAHVRIVDAVLDAARDLKGEK